ncbi:hypothetical protein F7725_008350 [Dissostichus mawsoni]|uniref:Uncharacterized protein n=1 Tax=Dissostichus mawsoni TaxID=36200 RepID=A0A7J5Y9D1_DISMA|nr:hypothetical protein F7725_008350 [Dissostichus mawsoni]
MPRCSELTVTHRFDVTMQEAHRVDALDGFQDLPPQTQRGADAEGSPSHAPPQHGDLHLEHLFGLLGRLHLQRHADPRQEVHRLQAGSPNWTQRLNPKESDPQGEHGQDVSLLRSPAHPVCGPGTLSSLLPPPRPATSN